MKEWRLTRLAHFLLAPILLALVAFPSLAGEYPERPVTLVVPFPPGGSTYYTATIVAAQLEKALGQPFVLETRYGNFGFNAMRYMLEKPDGYRLMFGNVTTNSTSPVFHRDAMDFDFEKEIVPVSRLAEFPLVFMTQRSFPAETLEGFFAHLKKTSGKLTFGTDLPGSFFDLNMMALAKAGGLELQYLATSGSNAIFANLVDGKIDIVGLNVVTATRNAGKFKPLAVASPRRLANFPDVPTLAETGTPDHGINLWQGLFAPRGTPGEVIDLLHETLVVGMNSAEVKEIFETINAFVVTSESPAAFAAEIAAEMDLWKK